MKLYHYSKEQHKVIESLQARNKEGSGERLNLDAAGVLPPYNTSISFFLNKIPLDLPNILDNKHSFWKNGSRLFEYEIDSSSLPDDIIYYIAETPERNKFTDEFDWSKASDPEVRKEYMFVIREYEIMKDLIGQGRHEFEKIAKRYSGDLGRFYEKGYKMAKKDDELDSFFSKYASYVPHAMVYHEDFKISKFECIEITLGNKLGLEKFSNQPPSMIW